MKYQALSFFDYWYPDLYRKDLYCFLPLLSLLPNCLRVELDLSGPFVSDTKKYRPPPIKTKREDFAVHHKHI